jgi:hypothetical protein
VQETLQTEGRSSAHSSCAEGGFFHDSIAKEKFKARSTQQRETQKKVKKKCTPHQSNPFTETIPIVPPANNA